MSTNRAVGTSTRSELQDVIECPICCLRFERPLQLSCGHSFCGNCVDRLVADSRADMNRNENFDAIGGGVQVVPNINRAMDHPNNVNRMDGEIWMQYPRAPQPQPPLPGLGGFPYARYLFRNIGPYDEPPPFVHRRVNLFGAAGGGDHIIKCPECRQPTRIPPEGLPINYRLQEVLARVAETGTNSVTQDVHSSEVDVPLHPTCLVCNDAMTKGVYFFCRSCVGENVHQLCSMCCLRDHNGHDIEERRFVTMNDVEAAREMVSEATGRGYQAVDHTMNEFSTTADAAKEYLQLSTHNVLQAFEAIANDMQFELLSCHDELDYKVKMAQDICSKLEQLPGTIKDVVEEFRNRIVTVMNEFVDSTSLQEGSGEEVGNGDVIDRNPNMDISLGNLEDCTSASESSSVNSFVYDHMDRRNSQKVCPLHECRSQQTRTGPKQSNVLRNRACVRARLNEQILQEGFTSNHQWDLESDRERRERIHDEYRDGFLDSDDARVPRERTVRLHAPLPRTALSPVPKSDYTTAPPGSQQINESRGNESIEIISVTPSAVTELEQRAGRLIITPDRRRLRSDLSVAVENRIQAAEMAAQTKLKSKHRRGGETSSVESTTENKFHDNGECLAASESISSHGFKKKRKYGVIEPGPSSFFVSFTNDDDLVDNGINSTHGDANVTKTENKVEELSFHE